VQAPPAGCFVSYATIVPMRQKNFKKHQEFFGVIITSIKNL
jgi:hypothetical protein